MNYEISSTFYEHSTGELLDAPNEQNFWNTNHRKTVELGSQPCNRTLSVLANFACIYMNVRTGRGTYSFFENYGLKCEAKL